MSPSPKPQARKSAQKKAKPKSALKQISCTGNSCKVEAIVSVDARGQLVLPKEFRERTGIRAGERFALASWDMGGELCCITLMRVDELAPKIKSVLGPLMRDIMPEQSPED